MSQDLRVAFGGLAPSGRHFAIVASIEGEQIVTRHVLPILSEAFLSNVEQLESALNTDEAAYILLRRYNDVSDGLAAVTFVPDSANVRQKMLFASTRLTLVRELGPERFRETLFATTKEELTADGWRKHDEHGTLKAPLTSEELTLQGVREAEVEASGGTSTRRSHVGSGLHLAVSERAMDALRQLRNVAGLLVQLVTLYHTQIVSSRVSHCLADGHSGLTPITKASSWSVQRPQRLQS